MTEPRDFPDGPDMLKFFTEMGARLRGKRSASAADIAMIRHFYAERALTCGGDSLREFLRALNNSQDANALWDMRTEFYGLVSRTHGEYRALEDSKTLHTLFAPLVAKGKVKAARPRASATGSTGPLSSSFNLSTQSFARVQAERVAEHVRASENALKSIRAVEASANDSKPPSADAKTS
jgi:hypothetical protein